MKQKYKLAIVTTLAIINFILGFVLWANLSWLNPVIGMFILIAIPFWCAMIGAAHEPENVVLILDKNG